MFTGGIGAVSLASYVDPTKPRLQPERPTNVDLPDYSILPNHVPTDWIDEASRPNFRRRYTQLKRPSDINGQLLHDFNFNITPPTSAHEVVPRDPYGRSYLPQPEQPDTSELAEPTEKQLAPFSNRDVELKIDNDIVYRIVCREKLPEGVERVRLANFRNFYSALEGMSEHWETDLDHYFIAGEANYQDDDLPLPNGDDDLHTIPENDTDPISLTAAGMFTEEGQAQAPSKPSMFSGFNNNGTPFTFSGDKDAPMKGTTAQELPISPTTLSGVLQQSNGNFPFRTPPIRTLSTDSMGSSSSSEADIPIPMYRGRRISSGVKMPGLYRTETVKGFLEAAVFNFNCRLSLPRAPAALMVSGVRVPIRHQTFLVHRVPLDRGIARQGIAEGPVMGSFVRQDIEAFSEGNLETRRERLRLDLLKEMGCLLHLAQERRRDGRQERLWNKPAPRGGQWFSEMASDGSKPEDSPGEVKTEAERRAIEADRRRKKVKTKYDTWKEMSPQRPLWDPRVRYTAVGREEGSDWDEVYMLSSMYHHVSIVKLRVHGAYVDYITDGKVPDPLPEDPKWCQPAMVRSQWFDLFDIQQRVEAFRCLWGVMCYLTRQGPSRSGS